MNRYSLRNLLFLTICCDLGLFSKRLIAPAANILTDFMRIPGGIGTSFSLMFIVVAAELVPIFGCATLMSIIQSMIALSLGMVGSMGILSPIGYIVPGIVVPSARYPARIIRRCGTSKRRGVRLLRRCSGQKTSPRFVRLQCLWLRRAKCFSGKPCAKKLKIF